MPILPSSSTPMMPALADDSTASIKRRRLSITSLARTRSSRWLRSSLVILLKVSPRLARSPSDLLTGTCTCRSPVDTRLAAAISRRIGATSQLAKFSPISTADISTRQRDDGEDQRKGDLNAEPAGLQFGILGDARFGGAHLRDDARVEQPRDVEEDVVVGAQANDGRDVVLS